MVGHLLHLVMSSIQSVSQSADTCFQWQDIWVGGTCIPLPETELPDPIVVFPGGHCPERGYRHRERRLSAIGMRDLSSRSGFIAKDFERKTDFDLSTGEGLELFANVLPASMMEVSDLGWLPREGGRDRSRKRCLT